MGKYLSLIIVLFIFLLPIVVLAQQDTVSKNIIPQLSDFQRFQFGVSENDINKSTAEKIKEANEPSYRYAKRKQYSSISYYSKLCGINVLIRYDFYKSKLYAINFKTNCINEKQIVKMYGKSNACTSRALKEYIYFTDILEELLGHTYKCVGCTDCYTKPIHIPTKYYHRFEQELINLAKKYPGNFKICVSWFEYTNNSTISLSYRIDTGWNIYIQYNEKKQ